MSDDKLHDSVWVNIANPGGKPLRMYFESTDLALDPAEAAYEITLDGELMLMAHPALRPKMTLRPRSPKMREYAHQRINLKLGRQNLTGSARLFTVMPNGDIVQYRAAFEDGLVRSMEELPRIPFSEPS